MRSRKQCNLYILQLQAVTSLHPLFLSSALVETASWFMIRTEELRATLHYSA